MFRWIWPLTLPLALLGPAAALANPGWRLTLPSHATAAEWMKTAGFEEQKGSAERWRVVDGALRTEQDDDSTTIGTKRGFPLAAEAHRRLKFSFRVEVAPEGADVRKKGTEDAALRVFVVFDEGGGLFSPPATLGYAFGTDEPAGSFLTSDRFDQVKYVVVASRKTHGAGQWIDVERDLVADYRAAFGKERVPAIAALAIKSDANDTGTKARAELRALSFEP